MTTGHTPDDEETSVYTVVQPAVPTVLAAPTASPAPPSAAPPAVMPPLYPPTYRPAAQETTARAVFAAVVLTIFGITQAVGGTVGAIAASTLRRTFDQLLRSAGVHVEAAALTGVLTATFLTLLLLGVLQLVAAGGILGHRRWSRWLGVVISLAGTLAGAWLVYRLIAAGDARGGAIVAPLLVLVPYLISLLGLLFPGRHFRGARSS